MMVDIEKVIKGLECCIKSGCGGCPYFKDNPSCQDDKDKEALELLKELKKIVRCKDCRKSVCYDRVDGSKIYTCKNICGVMSGEYFCADGERK